MLNGEVTYNGVPLSLVSNDFNPDQPRDSSGRWTQGSGVVQGGKVERLVSGTVGRLNPLTLLSAIVQPRIYHSAVHGDRPAAHQEVFRAMQRTRPEQLKDTALRLEGTDVVDDYLWKKEKPGEELPWTDKIGGRNWQNPRTTLLKKAVDSIAAPYQVAMTNLRRGSHYNPGTDVATVFGDETAVTSHELGHAIDFNDKNKDLPGWKGRVWRDVYGIAGALPGAKLWHEAQANLKSRDALEEAYKNDPGKLHDIFKRRQAVLPAGYGSYVGGALGGPAGAITGIVGGKIYGLTEAARMKKLEVTTNGVPLSLVSNDYDPDEPRDEKGRWTSTLRTVGKFTLKHLPKLNYGAHGLVHGSNLGAMTGAVLGSAAGPVVAGVGALGGAAVGGIGGAIAGYKTGKSVGSTHHEAVDQQGYAKGGSRLIHSTVGETVGGLAGGVGGLLAGGLAGSVAGPVGTALGGYAGAMGGIYLGAKYGAKGGLKASDYTHAGLQKVKEGIHKVTANGVPLSLIDNTWSDAARTAAAGIRKVGSAIATGAKAVGHAALVGPKGLAREAGHKPRPLIGSGKWV